MSGGSFAIAVKKLVGTAVLTIFVSSGPSLDAAGADATCFSASIA